MAALVTMYDTIGANADRIPANAVKVAGYRTGSGGIEWSTANWARFPDAGKVVIDQSPGGLAYASGTANVYDIEQNAGTIAEFAIVAASRHQRGMGNCPYASRSNLQATAAAFDAIKNDGWWRGMDAWLADPNLSLSEASALVGTNLFGFTIRAVQWAWPSTNPDTSVPGGTLKSLNLDLSVAEAAWFPARAPAPPPWPAQALTEAKGAQVHLTSLIKILEAHQ